MSLIDPSFVAEDAPGDPVLGMVTAAANPDIEGVIEKTVLASGMSARSVQLPLMSEAFDAALAIIGAENWVAFGHLVDAPGLGPDVRARLHAASGITARQLAAAEAVRTRFRREVDEALCGVGALVLPTLPIVPPMLQEAANAAAMIPVTALLRPFNLSGHPALTIPLQTAAGLPAGLQLVARQGADAALCALGTLLAVRLGIQIDPATAG
jgi:amidase